MAVFDNGVVTHFGMKNPTVGAYIDHADDEIKKNYIRRHSQAGENWNNPYSAGALSRWILWGPSPDIRINIDRFNRLFNV